MRLRATALGLVAGLAGVGGALISAQSTGRIPCADLVQLRLLRTTIGSASLSASGPVATCRVTGEIKPTAASEIRFAVWMPVENWNGKFSSVGNQGWGGALTIAGQGQGGGLTGQVKLGYASASTDTGHGPGRGMDGAKFGYEQRDLVVDFAYRAHHETALAAKAVITAFYGQPPRHSYFIGNSTGGGQALMAAQRFPEDYDGIIAGTPANNWTKLMTAQLEATVAVLKEPANHLPQAALNSLHRAVLAACDKTDGVVDGVLENPPTCSFDPSVLTCGGTAPPGECLTVPQINAVRHIYAGLKSPRDGSQLFPGLALGSEPQWSRAFDPDTPNEIPLSHYRWLVLKNPEWDWRTFDFGSPAGFNAFEKGEADLAPILNATNPDLRAFRERGGKLIQFHGWSDPLIAPQNDINYYESVVSLIGGTRRERAAALADVQSFYRLFMVPGMGHAPGTPPNPANASPHPNEFDMQTALERWVERGIAPERVITTHLTNGVGDRTRPLCPYPQVAVYAGSGDPNIAESFKCGASTQGRTP